MQQSHINSYFKSVSGRIRGNRGGSSNPYIYNIDAI